MVNLARYLKKEGVDVTVASSGGNLTEILERDNVPHMALDIKTKFEFSIKVWKALPVLAQLVKDNGIQLVHAHTRVTQVLGELLEKITKVPFMSTGHGFFKYRRLSRRIFPCWGKKIIAISNSVRKHLIEDFHIDSDSITRIYTGIELKRYQFMPEDKDYDCMMNLGMNKNAVTIGTIGRLSSVKGFKYLISAFKDVLMQNRNVQLLVVGEGPEEENLRRQILELGIKDKVFLVPGSVFLERYLSLLDIFCLPSIHEGLGLSLMEAMAAGRACIASDVGGLPELIIHETDGILVPPKDSSALTSAILRLVNDSQFRNRLAVNAREKAMKSFSIEECVKQVIEVYREVIK